VRPSDIYGLYTQLKSKVNQANSFVVMHLLLFLNLFTEKNRRSYELSGIRMMMNTRLERMEGDM
jgi:hypothetical protein